MYIFRPHKGTLMESLSYAIEFETEEEMLDYIVKYYHNKFTVEDIVLDDSKEVNDYRTGWVNTRSVLVKRFGEADYIALYKSPQCIGMYATHYFRK